MKPRGDEKGLVAGVVGGDGHVLHLDVLRPVQVQPDEIAAHGVAHGAAAFNADAVTVAADDIAFPGGPGAHRPVSTDGVVLGAIFDHHPVPPKMEYLQTLDHVAIRGDEDAVVIRRRPTALQDDPRITGIDQEVTLSE